MGESRVRREMEREQSEQRETAEIEKADRDGERAQRSSEMERGVCTSERNVERDHDHH